MSTIQLNFKKDKLKSIIKDNGIKNYSHLPKSELEKIVNQLERRYPKVESKTKNVEEGQKYKRNNDSFISKKQLKRPQRRLESVTQGK